MSKWSAKFLTGAKVIESPRSEVEQWLVTTVKRQADQARIGMPDVAVYDSPEVNAFATGMRRNSALVAVSTGLLRSMSRDEAEAVLAHELGHFKRRHILKHLILTSLITLIGFALLGWLMQQAWKIARNDLRKIPSTTDYLPSDVADPPEGASTK